MKSWSVMVLSVGLLALCPCVADVTPAPVPAVADTKVPAKPDPDEVICVRSKMTGSNLLGPRICKPRKVWQQQHQDAQDLLNQQQKNGMLGQPAGN